LIFEGDFYKEARDLIRVTIGAFRRYKEYFPISLRAFELLKKLARDAFAMDNFNAVSQSSASSTDHPVDGIDPLFHSEMFADIFGQLETVDPSWIWSTDGSLG
jgi:hypothetical protein